MQGILAGSIHKEVELRPSRNGKPFATFTIRENVNGKTRWWQAIAFSESAIEELRQLDAGSPVAVAGMVDAEIYAPAGSEGRINWRVTVDAVLSAYRKPKPKAERAARAVPRTGRAIAEASWAAPAMGGDDASDAPF
jgi:hypothetical protein